MYFLGITFVPCQDGVIDSDSDTTEFISDSNQHDHHQHMELCSPFCSCQCCHTKIDTYHLHDYRITSIIISSDIFTYHNDVKQNVVIPLLHPPQV